MIRAVVAGPLRPAAPAPPPRAPPAPPPTPLDFENAPLTGTFDGAFYPGVTLNAACGTGSFAAADPIGCAQITSPGGASQRSLEVFGGDLDIRFAQPQATVSLWVSATNDVDV